MRVVTLMGLALAGLVVLAHSGTGVLARGQSVQPAVQPQAAPVPPDTAGPSQTAAAPSAAGRTGAPSGIRAADKRRRSYASCNRESHNRSLRGGARRRFLIRCKLGYERRRQGQQLAPSAPVQSPQQKAPAAQPQAPVKRP